MKPGLPFRSSPERYQATAIETRKAYRELAAMVESGKLLNAVERRIIAAALRDVAANFSTVAPKAEGHPPQYDHGGAVLRWAWLQHHKGKTPTAAMRMVASEYGVTIEAIGKLTKRFGALAMQQFVVGEKRTRDLAAEKKLRDLLRAARSKTSL